MQGGQGAGGDVQQGRAGDKRWADCLGFGQPGDVAVGMGEGQTLIRGTSPVWRPASRRIHWEASASPAADLEPPGTHARGQDSCGLGDRTGSLRPQRGIAGNLEGRACSCEVRPRPLRASGGVSGCLDPAGHPPTGLRFSGGELWLWLLSRESRAHREAS